MPATVKPVNEKMNHDVYESDYESNILVDYADHFSIDEIDNSRYVLNKDASDERSEKYVKNKIWKNGTFNRGNFFKHGPIIQLVNKIFMESLILAQNERWR